MAANLSAKGKEEPQIVIIVEMHPLWSLEASLLPCVTLLLISKREKKFQQEELESLLEFLINLQSNVKYTSEEETKFLKAYANQTILIERAVKEEQEATELKNVEFYKKIYALLSKTLGKEFYDNALEVLNAAEESYKLTEKYKSLEFPIIQKIMWPVYIKFPPKLFKFFDILRETPVQLRLIKEAKKSIKSGKRVLIICGSAHAKRYAKALKKFGYRCEVILLDEGVEEMVNEGFNKLKKITDKHNIKIEEIAKFSPLLKDVLGK